MRLFLSSQELGNYADVAVELAGSNLKAAYIKNSQDDLPAEQRNFSTPQRKELYEQLGFEFEEVDLRDYFGKATELEAKLQDFGSVWCAGGNTFILRRAMKASGLDEILKKRLAEDTILYGGWSAGACITARSLKGLERGDRPEPSIVPDVYPIKETIWEGLGLVDFTIVPHMDQDWFKADAEQCIRQLTELGVDYRPLNDGQVIIVDGDREELLS